MLEGIKDGGGDLGQEEEQEAYEVLLCSECGVDAEMVPEEEIFSFDEMGRLFYPNCWEKR